MWHWVMYFFVALAGAGLLVVSTVGAGVTYHNYKVKKRHLCDPHNCK